MLNKLSIILTISLFVSSACTPEKYDIHAVCEMNTDGDYLIKWETFPPVDGIVKIYQSSNPEIFNLNQVAGEQIIKNGFITIVKDHHDVKRSYFKLYFNKDFSTIVAERNIKAEGIFNLRDLGGYYDNEGREMKWGKIYRSSSLENASDEDIETLNNLGIKTIIDLRSSEEIYNSSSKFKAFQTFYFPLRTEDFDILQEKIVLEEMKKGDVIIKLQDIYINLLENNKDYIIKLLDILLDEDKYPILIQSSLGKDRTGIISALILKSLDINRDQVMSDYMLSNENIDPKAVLSYGRVLPYDIQEALTTLLSANEEVLNYAFEKIDKDYGSMDNYLTKELKFTHKKQDKLKDLLLY